MKTLGWILFVISLVVVIWMSFRMYLMISTGFILTSNNEFMGVLAVIVVSAICVGVGWKLAHPKRAQASINHFQCPQCNTHVIESQKYCPQCGIQLIWN